MQHPRRGLLFALAIAVLAPTAHAQTMRFQFKEKDKLAYSIEQKTKSTIELMGAKVDSDINASMTLQWEVLKVDREGNAQIKVKMTRSKLAMDSIIGRAEVDSESKDAPGDAIGKMLAPMNKAIAAMEITATMLPTGELKDVKVSEATVKAMKAIPGAEQFGDLAHPDNFKDMISNIVFPTEAIAKGKSWKTKTETTSPEGKVKTETVFTLEETIDQDGTKLEKISLKPKIEVEPAPKAMMKVKSVEASGHILFDNKTGQLVESTVSQTKVGKVNAMGLTLDNTSVQTTTIRLTKQTAAEKLAAAKKIESLKIDETEFVEKAAGTELLETIAGVSRSFTVERSYEPSITMTGSATASDELKAKVESALSVTLGKKTMLKESVTLDGKEVTKLNAVWVERYRKGTATTVDGSTIEILVKVGMRLKLEKAK
jgi:Family of unknown function (DUF6263)